MGNNLAERLKNIRLSKSEKRIVNQLTRNLYKTAFLAGPELAELCEVAPSSITRLAQKLGYSGFPELKKELEHLYRKTATPYEMFESFLSHVNKDSVPQVSIAQDIQNLVNMQKCLNIDVLNTIVSRLNRARIIYLAAIGSSEICVELLDSFLSALQKQSVKLIGYGISKKIELVDIIPSDVMVAFSFQRILKEVRDTAIYAKAKRATTIAITDSEFSPLAMVCDLTLVVPVIGTTFGLSHAASVAMVNLIANCLAALNPDKNLKILEKTKEQWNKLPIFALPIEKGDSHV
jgi:DNA-binding MurR/RpiR family transcriptional regulator